MRVIDADKIIDKMLVNFPFEIDKQYESIWGVPIIEAIPIEWIKKKLLSRQYEYENDYDKGFDKGWNCAIKTLLKDWEKENG